MFRPQDPLRCLSTHIPSVPSLENDSLNRGEHFDNDWSKKALLYISPGVETLHLGARLVKGRMGVTESGQLAACPFLKHYRLSYAPPKSRSMQHTHTPKRPKERYAVCRNAFCHYFVEARLG